MISKLIATILLIGLVGAIPPPLSRSRVAPPTHRRLGIYGGTNATIENYPYLVSIVYEEAWSCTAVIVSDSWVLALPSCVEYQEPSGLTIVAESEDGVTGVSYAVRNWHVHPKYYPSDYEFALIQIHGTFSLSSKTQIAKLPSAQPAADTVMQVAGWGETSVGGAGGSLQQGNMTWLSKKYCKMLFGGMVGVGTFSSRMACIDNHGGTTLCSEDWGVPAVSNGVVYGQLVLMITDNYCTASAAPLLISDIFPVVSWISKITGATVQ